MYGFIFNIIINFGWIFIIVYDASVVMELPLGFAYLTFSNCVKVEALGRKVNGLWCSLLIFN
jgi:hypothetical protein